MSLYCFLKILCCCRSTVAGNILIIVLFLLLVISGLLFVIRFLETSVLVVYGLWKHLNFCCYTVAGNICRAGNKLWVFTITAVHLKARNRNQISFFFNRSATKYNLPLVIVYALTLYFTFIDSHDTLKSFLRCNRITNIFFTD